MYNAPQAQNADMIISPYNSLQFPQNFIPTPHFSQPYSGSGFAHHHQLHPLNRSYNNLSHSQLNPHHQHVPAEDAQIEHEIEEIENRVGRWWWWDRSYIFDWLTIVGIWAVLAPFNFLVDGYERPYLRPSPFNGQRTSDNVFDYPMESDTIPVWLMALMHFLFPLLFFIFFSGYIYRSIHDFHHAILGFAECMTIAFGIQMVTTRTSGALRPDFNSRLASGDEKDISHGRTSFPSGHTTAAYASMLYLSLYLCGKFHIKRPGCGRLWKVAIGILLPIGISVAISLTRSTDNRHHPADITCGAIVGAFGAGLGYFCQYPSLESENCAFPKIRHNPLKNVAEIAAADQPLGQPQELQTVAPPTADYNHPMVYPATHYAVY